MSMNIDTKPMSDEMKSACEYLEQFTLDEIGALFVTRAKSEDVPIVVSYISNEKSVIASCGSSAVCTGLIHRLEVLDRCDIVEEFISARGKEK
jgi:hypothetical protein